MAARRCEHVCHRGCTHRSSDRTRHGRGLSNSLSTTLLKPVIDGADAGQAEVYPTLSARVSALWRAASALSRTGEKQFAFRWHFFRASRTATAIACLGQSAAEERRRLLDCSTESCLPLARLTNSVTSKAVDNFSSGIRRARQMRSLQKEWDSKAIERIP